MNRDTRSLRSRWSALPLWTKLWWCAGPVLLLMVGVFANLDLGGGCVSVMCVGLFFLWAAPSATWALHWTWRKLTYRIGVRLLVSYLLIGVLPFPLLAVLGGFGCYVLIGQYASAELGDLGIRVHQRLADFVETALAANDPDETQTILRAGPRFSSELVHLSTQVHWFFAAGNEGIEESSDEESPLGTPLWARQGLDSGLFLTSQGGAFAAIARRDDRTVVAWVPLTAATSRAFSQGRWYEARFLDETVVVDDSEGFELESGERSAQDQVELEGGSLKVKTGPVADEQLLETAMKGDGWWEKRWIFFFRLSPELRRWEDGEVLPKQSLATFLVTSPQEASSDLFRSPYRLDQAVWGVLTGVAFFFLFVYLVAVGLAALLIFNITRSTARLTTGARKVEAGKLDHRIPVKRKDQLGELATSFNRMTDSVQHMISDVAEKERLKSEFELAREIQESLLPDKLLRHGGLEVRAYFRPAAEVGGDYFDLFPLEPGRLIVAAGDVAGHGLSTGLLMAMVKSAVSTLISEGHRGGALLERLNRFMLEQPRGHRMVTLALAEIDVPKGTAEITNAAHPPLFLTGSSVEEVMLPALPVGFPWKDAPPSRILQLEPDARLVFYSDGLVEAVGDDDEQFGYERFHTFLSDHLELSSDDLLVSLLAALQDHTGGRQLDDDLTILIIDCGADSEVEEAAASHQAGPAVP